MTVHIAVGELSSSAQSVTQEGVKGATQEGSATAPIHTTALNVVGLQSVTQVVR